MKTGIFTKASMFKPAVINKAYHRNDNNLAIPFPPMKWNVRF